MTSFSRALLKYDPSATFDCMMLAQDPERLKLLKDKLEIESEKTREFLDFYRRYQSLPPRQSFMSEYARPTLLTECTKLFQEVEKARQDVVDSVPRITSRPRACAIDLDERPVPLFQKK